MKGLKVGELLQAIKSDKKKMALAGGGAFVLLLILVAVAQQGGQEPAKRDEVKRLNEKARKVVQQRPQNRVGDAGRERGVPPVVKPVKRKPKPKDDIFMNEVIRRLKDQVVQEVDALVAKRVKEEAEKIRVELRKELIQTQLTPASAGKGKGKGKEKEGSKKPAVSIEPVKVKFIVEGERARVVFKGNETMIYVGSRFPYPECEVVDIRRKEIVTSCFGKEFYIPVMR